MIEATNEQFTLAIEAMCRAMHRRVIRAPSYGYDCLICKDCGEARVIIAVSEILLSDNNNHPNAGIPDCPKSKLELQNYPEVQLSQKDRPALDSRRLGIEKRLRPAMYDWVHSGPLTEAARWKDIMNLVKEWVS